MALRTGSTLLLAIACTGGAWAVGPEGRYFFDAQLSGLVVDGQVRRGVQPILASDISFQNHRFTSKFFEASGAWKLSGKTLILHLDRDSEKLKWFVFGFIGPTKPILTYQIKFDPQKDLIYFRGIHLPGERPGPKTYTFRHGL